MNKLVQKSFQKLVKKLTSKEKILLELQNKLVKIEELENQNWQKNIDPKIIKTFQKLGISLEEQKRLAGIDNQFGKKNEFINLAKNSQEISPNKEEIDKTEIIKTQNQNFNKIENILKSDKDQNIRQTAVDIVLDSVSIRTTFEQDLAKLGIIFCPISKAITNFPDLFQKYFGSVVPVADNFFACLNCAVFSEGTFVYVPKGVKCPMDLSTYFRINAANTGQFERTLIIADVGSSVSYLEGCTAPEQKENQLHAAVVELIALEGAEIKYSTVQNWFAGNNKGVGGVYNLVTKRGICSNDAKISWTQVETGSAITWKYPSVVLKGDNSIGQFYSIAITKNHQQADTGSKMIHLGKNSKSQIISKSISQDQTSNTYRGLVKITKNADNCYNFTSCDSLILENNLDELVPQYNSSNAQNSLENWKGIDQSDQNKSNKNKEKSPNWAKIEKNTPKSKKEIINWVKIEKIITKLIN